MKYTRKRIYDLLPAIHRQRDIENGSPLKALVNIIAEQIKIVEDDIEGLHDNWFIETCDEWAVAYKADLIQARMLYPVSDATYSMRTWVANTIGYRRRKGTLAVLEQLARDVTGWDAKAVEFFELLITTQYLNHCRPSNLSTPDLRDTEQLDRLSTPFNTVSHSLDVRRISRQRGYYNIPNIGIFFWRLQSLPRNCRAFDHGEGRFSFNQLGYDEPLFNHRKLEIDDSGVAEEINISAPIRMRAMDQSVSSYYYDNSIEEKGETDQKSLQITVDGSIKSQASIKVCNLTNWDHRPPLGQIAVDPVLGRMTFPKEETPSHSVHTRYYYGFSSKIGGGFYARPMLYPDFVAVEEAPEVYRISKTSTADPGKIYTTLTEATSKWLAEGRKNAIFEILDSESYYEASLELDIPSQVRIVIRSKQQQQAVLRVHEPIRIKGNSGGGSSIIFDGLIFDTVQEEEVAEDEEEENTNNTILNILQGDLESLIFSHCTLVPGRNEAAYYASKFLFNWKSILGSPTDTVRLKDFLFKGFENLKWINDPEVKFEFITEKILKISLSSVSDHFLTISIDGTQARLEINYSEGAGGEPSPPASPKHSPETLYDFIVTETDDGEIGIYNPKFSLIMTASGSNENLVVSLDSTISGRIFMTQSEAKVKLNNSIVDGKGSVDALTCYQCTAMENSTIFGRVNFSILELASNIIFTDIVLVKRLQTGCVRFCYVPPGSRTPRRYHCQPEYFNATRAPLVGGKDDTNDGDISMNLIPKFTSVVYGDPGYAQLHKNNIPGPIFDGGDNGSEIGVFNHLHQAQRIKNMKSSLDEYLRFGLEAGIFLVS